MRTIGIIGGMSWESSKAYYEYSDQIMKERLGGSHSAKSIMSSVDFAEIEKLTFEGNWGKIGDIMADHATKLEKAGAELILLGTNTIHIVGNRISEAASIPFLHIADATGKVVRAKGLEKIALLGTKFTMEKDFYTKILRDKYRLEVIIPSEEERQVIHDIIYNELVRGEFTESSKQICIAIIENLRKQGAEGVILGCTELPILIPESEVTIPTFNTTKIHVEAAIDFALTDQ
ncbi:MAG: aspartate/glutamate racemase family protein [Aurantibacter sp.]